MTEWCGTLLAVLAVLLGLAVGAHAHPIVSTDVNRHVTLTVADDRIEIRYIYEMLEIAAIDVARTWDVDGDGLTTPEERDLFLDSWSAELARNLRIELDAVPVPLAVASTRWNLGDGAFGLKTWKIVALLTGRLPVGGTLGELEYRDLLRPDQAGWKELILVVRGSTSVARASVPAQDRSYELTDYAAMADLPNPSQTSATALLRFPLAEVAESMRAAAPVAGERVEPPARPSQRPVPSAARARVAQQLATAPAAGQASTPAPSVAEPISPADAAPIAPSAMRAAWAHYAGPFFRLGMHHIATGLDHMLFLLGLLLFRQSPGRLAAVITSFTLAHSVTLAVSAAGWVTPPGPAIEVLVASSIAYVGAASLLGPRSGHGPWIALVFGLVHGFGFAGVLQQALAGVSGERAWLVALASFNVGIEVLQLLAVAIGWPLLRYIDRLDASAALRRMLSFVVMSAGIGWMAAHLVSLQ